MAQPTAWLIPCIEKELHAIIAWKKGALRKSTDPTRRMTHDGSNFRSKLSSAHLPQYPRVQVTKILSCDEEVKVLVTDSHVQLRASLSQDVKSVLEEEIGDAITLDATGDVITVLEMDIVSTPLGPIEGYFRINIKHAKYEFHRRKVLPNVQPIEDVSSLSALVDEGLRPLQEQQFAADLDPGVVDLTSDDTISGAADSAAQRMKQTLQTRGAVKISQRSTTEPRQHTQMQNMIASQISLGSQLKNPSLTSDGFEIESGVNLHRPKSAMSQNATRGLQLRTIGAPLPDDSKTKRLLGLMQQGRVIEAAAKTPQTTPQPRPLSQLSSPASVLGKRARNTPNVEEIPAPEPAVEKQDSTLSAQPAKKPASAAAAPTSKPASPTARSPASHAKVTKPKWVQNRRRIIPRNQRKLLEQQCSWLPSLCGKSFPHPNVPVELLKDWNSTVAARALRCDGSPSSRDQDLHAREVQAEHGLSPNGTPNSKSRLSHHSSAEESDEVDEDDVEVLSWSETQGSPRSEGLPPDSTLETHDQEVPLAKSVPVRPVTKDTSLFQSSKLLQLDIMSSSQGCLTQASAPSALAPIKMPEELSTVACSGRFESAIADSVAAQRASTLGSPASKVQARMMGSSADALPAVSAEECTDNEASRPTANQLSQAVNPLHSKSSSSTSFKLQSREARIISQSSTPGFVKGRTTPTTKHVRDLDDLELSVPRTVEEDPAVAHRRRRRDFLAKSYAEPRKQWIRDHCRLTSPDEPGLGYHKVLSAYRTDRPKDNVGLSDFAEMIDECFPETRDQSSGLVLLGVPSTQNVSSSSQTKRSRADANVADTRSTPQSKNSAEVNATQLAASTPRRPDADWRHSRNDASHSEQGLATHSKPGKSCRLPWHSDHFESVVPTPSIALQSETTRSTPSKRTIAPRMQVNGTSSPSHSRSNNAFKSQRLPSSLRKLQSAGQAQGAETDPKNGRDSPKSLTVFEEFTRAWTAMRHRDTPSSGDDPRHVQKASRRQLHVLSWEL